MQSLTTQNMQKFATKKSHGVSVSQNGFMDSL